MMPAIKTFLNGLFQGLLLADGATPAYPAGAIFFGELPRDHLKDNEYAVACLPLQDRKKKDGRLIGRLRNPAATQYTFTRRRYRREILMRCFLWAPRYEDLWGETGFTGLVDQLEQAAAATRALADAANNIIWVELQDATRPWDGEAEKARTKRRPHLAIVRFRFDGGVHTTTDIPIVQSTEITPTVG